VQVSAKLYSLDEVDELDFRKGSGRSKRSLVEKNDLSVLGNRELVILSQKVRHELGLESSKRLCELLKGNTYRQEASKLLNSRFWRTITLSRAARVLFIENLGGRLLPEGNVASDGNTRGLAEKWANASRVFDLCDKLGEKYKVLQKGENWLDFTTLANGLIHLIGLGRAIVMKDYVAVGLSSTGLLLNAALGKIFKMFFRSGYEPEGLDLGQTLRLHKGLLEGTVVVKFLNVCRVFFASQVFKSLPLGVQYAFSVAKTTTVSLASEADLYVAVGESLHHLTTSFTAFSESGDVYDLFGRDPVLKDYNKLEVIRMKIEDLEGRKSFLAKGGLELSKVRVFLAEVEGRLRLPQYMAYIPLRESYNVVKSSVMRLLEPGGLGTQPFGLLAVGDPGTGKSAVQKGLEQMLKVRNGIPADGKITLTLQDVDHQIVPMVTLLVVMNDMGTAKDDTLPLSLIPLLQRHTDVSPLRENTAALDEKKTSSHNAQIFLGTTNSVRYQATKSVGYANKLNRRFLVLYMKWTQYAHDLAAAGKYDVGYTWAKVGGKQVKSPLVLYRFGYMDNDNSNWIHFVPSKFEFETTSHSVAMQYVHRKFEIHRSSQTEAPDVVQECPSGVCVDQCLCSLSMLEFLKLGKVTGSVEGPDDLARDFPQGFLSPEGNLLSQTNSRHLDLEEEEYLETEETVFGKHEGPNYEVFPDFTTMSGLYSLAGEGWDAIRRALVKIESKKVEIAVGCLIVGLMAQAIVGYAERPEALLRGTSPDVPVESSGQPTFPGVVPVYVTGDKSAGIVPPTVAVGRDNFLMHGLLLGTSLIATPAHFWRASSLYGSKEQPLGPKEGDLIRLGTLKVTFDERNLFFPEESRDLAFYFCGATPGVISNSEDFLLHREVGGAEGRGYMKGKSVTYVRDSQGYRVAPALTTNGDCGLPLVTSKNVLGIHVAGFYSVGRIDPLYGVACPVWREDFDRARDHFQGIGKICLSRGNLLPEGLDLEVKELTSQSDYAWVVKDMSEEDREKLGVVPLGQMKTQVKSRFSAHKTGMFENYSDLLTEECGKPLEHPHAVLVDGEWKSPVVTRLTHPHGGTFPSTLFSRAAQSLVDDLPDPVGKQRPLTLYEALVGVPGNPYLKGKDYTKSAGPVHLANGRPSRTIFVQESPEVFRVHPTALARYSFLKRQVLEGKSPVVITSMTVKDEVLSNSKIRENKKRLFGVTEVEWNVLLKEYLAPIHAYLMKNWESSGHACSINPGGPEWDFLGRKLESFAEGEGIAFTDFKHFDTSHEGIWAFVVEFYHLVAKKLGYTGEELLMVARLVAAQQFNLVIMEGIYHYTSRWLLSGFANTIFFNNIANLLLLRAFVMWKIPEVKPSTIYTHYVVGDDSIAGMRKSWRERLKLEDFKSFVTMCGYDITWGDKGRTGPLEYVGLEEADFVKRKFVFSETYGRYLGPLSFESVVKSLCYNTSTKVSQEERDRGALVCALHEMFLHGRARYDLIAGRAPPGYQIPTFKNLEASFLRGDLIVWDPDGGVEVPPLGVAGELRPEGNFALLGVAVSQAVIVQYTSTSVLLPALGLGEFPAIEVSWLAVLVSAYSLSPFGDMGNWWVPWLFTVWYQTVVRLLTLIFFLSVGVFPKDSSPIWELCILWGLDGLVFAVYMFYSRRLGRAAVARAAEWRIAREAERLFPFGARVC